MDGSMCHKDSFGEIGAGDDYGSTVIPELRIAGAGDDYGTVRKLALEAGFSRFDKRAKKGLSHSWKEWQFPQKSWHELV